MKPERTASKYWGHHRNMNYRLYAQDLEEYIGELEFLINNIPKKGADSFKIIMELIKYLENEGYEEITKHYRKRLKK